MWNTVWEAFGPPSWGFLAAGACRPAPRPPDAGSAPVGSRQRLVMSLYTSAAPRSCGAPRLDNRSLMRDAERVEWRCRPLPSSSIQTGSHGREARPAWCQRSSLTSSTWSGSSASQSISASGRWCCQAVLGEEMGVTRTRRRLRRPASPRGDGPGAGGTASRGRGRARPAVGSRG